MDCADTLLVVASFLTKRDLVALSGVSQLCRTIVTDALISYGEKQYLVWPCLKEDHVELAPPSQILAIGVLESEQRLLVLVRSGTDLPRAADLECCLYTQLIDESGNLVEHQKELPVCFAWSTSLVRFVGNRYLQCTTREGELHVFDCRIEAMLELPMGTDGFYASPNGDHFLLDLNRHVFFCTASAHLACWWEMSRLVDLKAGGAIYGAPARLQQSSLVATHLRAQVVPLPDPLLDAPAAAAAAARPDMSHLPPPPLTYFLGASSSAWRNFWMGSSSVLFANEDGVNLLTTTASQQLAAERLPCLTESCVDFVHNSCGDVCGSPDEVRDEYAIVNCREVRLHTVTYWPARSPVTGVQTVELAAIVPSRAVIKNVRIAISSSTYLLHLQQNAQDRVLLFSADLTLTRWVSIGRPSCLVLWRERVSLVTASLADDATDNFHPLVEALEGGLGCVYTFGMQPPEACAAATSDHFATSVKAISTVDENGLAVLRSGAGADAHSRSLSLPKSLNGVEALSWVAFGVVSASLLWTLSALCYNGWWLHLQLLFWCKVA